MAIRKTMLDQPRIESIETLDSEELARLASLGSAVGYCATPPSSLDSLSHAGQALYMEVEIFALCDAATDSGGKLNMLGVFETINSLNYPAVQPHCTIALRVRFDRIEEGDHRVKINLVDADGKSVIPPVEGNIAVQFPGESQSICANLVLDISGLKLDKPGAYSIDLAIDGRHEKSLPLNALKVKQPA